MNCSLCEQKPMLKKIKGCNGPSEEKFIFPASDVAYPNKRVEIGTCPAKFVTPDIFQLFEEYNLAEGRMSISEGNSLSPPYRDAWIAISAENRIAESITSKGK